MSGVSVGGLDAAERRKMKCERKYEELISLFVYSTCSHDSNLFSCSASHPAPYPIQYIRHSYSYNSMSCPAKYILIVGTMRRIENERAKQNRKHDT